VQKIQLDNTNGASRGPSEVVSHYLEAIYYIWAEGEPVRSARLADWLSVSRPTVTVALRRMSRDGMVRLNARKEIELTAKGLRMAAGIRRRPPRQPDPRLFEDGSSRGEAHQAGRGGARVDHEGLRGGRARGAPAARL